MIEPALWASHAAAELMRSRTATMSIAPSNDELTELGVSCRAKTSTLDARVRQRASALLAAHNFELHPTPMQVLSSARTSQSTRSRPHALAGSHDAS